MLQLCVLVETWHAVAKILLSVLGTRVSHLCASAAADPPHFKGRASATCVSGQQGTAGAPDDLGQRG